MITTVPTTHPLAPWPPFWPLCPPPTNFIPALCYSMSLFARMFFYRIFFYLLLFSVSFFNFFIFWGCISCHLTSFFIFFWSSFSLNCSLWFIRIEIVIQKNIPLSWSLSLYWIWFLLIFSVFYISEYVFCSYNRFFFLFVWSLFMNENFSLCFSSLYIVVCFVSCLFVDDLIHIVIWNIFHCSLFLCPHYLSPIYPSWWASIISCVFRVHFYFSFHRTRPSLSSSVVVLLWNETQSNKFIKFREISLQFDEPCACIGACLSSIAPRGE